MEKLDIKELKDYQKSQSKKIQEFMQIEKALFARKQKLTEFKQPIMLMARVNGEIEFSEEATKGLHKYIHSDGKERYLVLNPSMQLTFNYAGQKVKTYWCHEDYPLPLPYALSPVLTSDELRILIEKSQHDLQRLNAAETRAKGEMYWKILAGVALIIMAIVAYKILVPGSNGGETQIIQAAQQTAQAIPINTTAI